MSGDGRRGGDGAGVRGGEARPTACPARGGLDGLSPEAEAVAERAVPWVVSILLHVGVALVVLFTALMAMEDRAPARRIAVGEDGAGERPAARVAFASDKCPAPAVRERARRMPAGPGATAVMKRIAAGNGGIYKYVNLD